MGRVSKCAKTQQCAAAVGTVAMAKKIRTRKIQRQTVFDPKLKRKVKFDGQRRAHIVAGSGAVPKHIRRERQAARALAKAALATGKTGEETTAQPADMGGKSIPKRRKLKAWQRASRQTEPEKGPTIPSPRADLAKFLILARQNGVHVKSKSDMPALQDQKSMSKRFSKRIQPRRNSYNGQGLARPSAYIELQLGKFYSEFKTIFAEHIKEWGGRHLKGFRSNKDLGMEWRLRLKRKQAADPTVFVSRKDRLAQVRARSERKSILLFVKLLLTLCRNDLRITRGLPQAVA